MPLASQRNRTDGTPLQRRCNAGRQALSSLESPSHFPLTLSPLPLCDSRIRRHIAARGAREILASVLWIRLHTDSRFTFGSEEIACSFAPFTVTGTGVVCALLALFLPRLHFQNVFATHWNATEAFQFCCRGIERRIQALVLALD